MSVIDTWEYTFEVQLGWFPGCGWLRAPYYRDTWEGAMNEALQYAKFGASSGERVSIRVLRIDRTTGNEIPDDHTTVSRYR